MRITCAVVFLLLSASCAHAQASLGNHCTASATAASLNCAITLVANSALTISTATGSTFSSIGDTFSLSFATIYNNAGQGQILCALTGSNAGSDTVTVNFGASTPSNLDAVAFIGSTCNLDGTVQTTSSGGNPIAVNITTTKTNDLILGTFWANWTGGGGCNAPFNGTGGGGSLSIIGTIYNAVNTPSTITASCSPNFAGGSAAVAAFKLPPSGTVTTGPSKLVGPSKRH